MANVELKDIRKSFGSVEIIKGIDLTITHGEFVVFVGPSGCGKSTLLRLIAGLEEISSGTLKIGDKVVNDLPPKDRSIAMVFQSYALFPHMTVYDNVAFGLNIAGAPKDEIERKVQEAARILKMENLLARKPSQLSGGQRQRVAIGRAIIRNPKVFLFDEPLSNLDAALRVQMRLEIARLHQRLRATMVYVTHDQVEAMTLANRIVVFNDGRIEQVGTPMDLYERPANRFVAGFIGAPSMNFLPVRTNGSLIDWPGIAPLALPAGKAQVVELGIRPEHLVAVEEADADIAGDIEIIERLGAETYAYVRVAGQPADLTLRLPGETGHRPGSRIGLKLDWSRAHWFDADGRVL